MHRLQRLSAVGTPNTPPSSGSSSGALCGHTLRSQHQQLQRARRRRITASSASSSSTVSCNALREPWAGSRICAGQQQNAMRRSRALAAAATAPSHSAAPVEEDGADAAAAAAAEISVEQESLEILEWPAICRQVRFLNGRVQQHAGCAW